MPKVLDWDAALERLHGDRETLVEMVELFFEDCPELMGQIEDGLKNEHAAELRRAAHTLKGSLEVFGAKAASKAALEVEQLGEDGDFEAASEAVEELRGELDRVIPKLKERAGLE